MSLNDTQGKDMIRRLQHKRGRRSGEEMRQLQLEQVGFETVSFPVCTAHPDCHACKNGRCMALDRNDFGGQDCPFYKNSEVNRREQREGLEKLSRIGRTDLIDKYKRTFQELGIFGMPDFFTEQATAELDRYSEACLRELLSMDTDNRPEEVSVLLRLFSKPDGAKRTALEMQKTELEVFFHSEWYASITDLDGDRLISAARHQAVDKAKESIRRKHRKRLAEMGKAGTAAMRC